MTTSPDDSTPIQTQAERDRSARLAREAAALRENLRRRKQQSRERALPAYDEPPSSD